MEKLIVIFLAIGLGTLTGCTAGDGQPTDTPIEMSAAELETDTVDAGIPDIVQEEAQTWTKEEYEYCKRVSPGSEYSDWKIESIAHCYTYEDFDGMTLQVYRMNIMFLSRAKDSVILAGGMSMTEDGWVVPDYPNSRYLVFRQDGEVLTFLTRMFENDCEAGDDTFTHDLEHLLMLAELPQEVPTLTYSQEGELQTVPAVMMEENGYTFYLPDGGWYPCDFENWEDIDEKEKAYIYDAWTAWNNENVRFWTVRLEGKSSDEVKKELQDKGYTVLGDRMLRQDGETVYCVELKESKTDTWCVCSRYPIDSEEGYGAQIHAIAETFTISE